MSVSIRERAATTIRREWQNHRYGYGIILAFVAAGPLVVHFLFEDVTPWVGVFGGMAFGVYAALCAVPDKFYES
ncbi:MAG: hypothetical protein AAF430_03885 [Myxococcota bacterium]